MWSQHPLCVTPVVIKGADIAMFLFEGHVAGTWDGWQSGCLRAALSGTDDCPVARPLCMVFVSIISRISVLGAQGSPGQV